MAQAVAQLSGEEIVTQVIDLLQNGVTLKDLHGYTEQEMDAVYALAYNKYNQAKYEEAMHLFGFLLMHDQLERKYYKAFGSCLQMLKKYPEAIRNYSMASVFDVNDPEPTFHTAECLVALGMVEEACEAPEQSVLAALVPGVQQLVLVGDHFQLRPSVQPYEFETGCRMDISMFERLVGTKERPTKVGTRDVCVCGIVMSAPSGSSFAQCSPTASGAIQRDVH